MRQAIIWTNDDQIHWRKYAALGEDELNNTKSVNKLFRLHFINTFHCSTQILL